MNSIDAKVLAFPLLFLFFVYFICPYIGIDNVKVSVLSLNITIYIKCFKQLEKVTKEPIWI